MPFKLAHIVTCATITKMFENEVMMNKLQALNKKLIQLTNEFTQAVKDWVSSFPSHYHFTI